MLSAYIFAKQLINGEGLLLDASCGSGYGSEVLQFAGQYYGIDYADYCIDYAKRNYAAKNRNYLKSDIYNLKNCFDRKLFDYVISFETLEHLDYPDLALKVLFDLIVNGGVLICSIPLNHPDRIYHKKIYSYSDVKSLLEMVKEVRDFSLVEYHQVGVNIFEIKNELSKEETGTFIGVLKFKE